MRALRKFGIGLVVLAITLTGCNNGKANSTNKETTIASEVGSSNTTSTDCAYTDKLFDESYVHKINIEISDEDWQDLVTNATDETYYSCNITIDGETYKNIGLRAKGNSSLTQVANSDSDRYSFKVKFDKFDDKQSYYGLEKLSLNNIIQDATFMKDYLSYKMMGDFGVASPYVSYSYITINDKEWGLYLNVEDIDSSFLDRNYGEDHGELYKPATAIDNMNQGGKDKFNNKDANANANPNQAQNIDTNVADNTTKDQGQVENNTQSDEQTGDAQQGQPPANRPNMPEGFDPANRPDMPEGFNPTQMEGGGGPGGMGNNMEAIGADLKYTDDELSSYANIFDNAETKVDDADKNRLIASLKQLSTGENLEEVVDIDAILRYFVVHNFVDNYDSYTGSMLHNYYLYEENGKLSMLPWDYNLAFGAFGGGGMGGGRDRDLTKPEATVGEQSGAKTETTTDNQSTATSQVDMQKEVLEGEERFQSLGNQNSATQMINMAIDTPLSGTTEDERPLWSQLINNATYKEQYHKLFDEFLKNYLENGAVEKEIDRVTEMISPYIQKDPTAFYTYEEFQTGITTLKRFISLRTESIRKQLQGEIPATTEEQQSVSDQLVDGTSINLNDMGSNRMGNEQKKKN